MKQKTIIKEALKSKGYTQKQLAKVLNIGASYLSNLLNGRFNFTDKMLNTICNILDIDKSAVGIYDNNTLLKENEILKKEKSELKAENETLFKAIEQVNKIYKKLKAENEELKNFHINLVGVKECEIKELVKLKQTLREIKEIIHFNKTNRLSGGAYISIEQILQKISEVEALND